MVDLESMDVELESNSLNTISLIKVSDFSTHEFGTIKENIKHIQSRTPQFSIGHIFKEANSYADILVKMEACSSSHLCLWEAHPIGLSMSLFDDFTSTVFARH